MPTLTANQTITYVFVGNSLIPDNTTGTPVAGDEWASGTTEYGAFYDQYRVDASQIKIQITNRTGSSNLYDVVLLAAPVTTSTAAFIASLDALSYNDLKSWQYASWRTLGVLGSGNSTLWFNKFRRTKNMLSYRDSGDQRELLEEMPQPDGSGGTTPSSGAGQQNPQTFIYFLKIFDLASGQSGSLAVSVKMIMYTTMQTLRFRAQTVVPSG